MNVRRVEQIARQVEGQIDEDKVSRFQEHKRSLEEKEQVKHKLINSDNRVPKQLKKPVEEKKTTSGEARIPAHKRAIQTSKSSANTKISATKKRFQPAKEQGRCEGDAFARNQQDLLPFVREFYKRHRRFPDVEQALIHLRDNGLFSGEWEDNENRRAKRVGDILTFVSQSFDANQLGSDESKPLSLSPGKFSLWVRQQFGSKITAKVADVRRFDPVTMSAPFQKVSIPAKFIETFLLVADVCLNQDPLDNKAVPTTRFKKIWDMVEGGPTWNQRYFQIIRDKLDRMGVIQIFDREHTTGKAWRWKAGPNFPAGSWKDEQRKLKNRCRKLKSCSGELLAGTSLKRRERVHNTLYQTADRISEFSGIQQVIRPPP